MARKGNIATFLIFDLPSMAVMVLHRAFQMATGREARQWNIWAYRFLGMIGLALVVIIVASASS